jgi:uncharacterized protein YecE (DUF72 family)
MTVTGKLYVGTSGYAYKPWKGSFYPEKLPDKEMLKFYASRLATVEINYSFYQMPKESTLQGWASNVPEDFQFALKANQKITHVARLRNCESTLKRFLEVANVLREGNRLGPILVQLPPNFKFDSALLAEFLALRPTAFRFALEVRHASWYTEETYQLLRQFDTALCLAETDEATPPEVVTAGFVYVRLRREEYSARELAGWRKRFDGWTQQGVDVYCYVKHEDAGKGPKYARQLLEPGA